MMPARAGGAAAKAAARKTVTRRPGLAPRTPVLTRPPAGKTPRLLRPSTPAALEAAQHRPRCSPSASQTSKAWALAPRHRGQSSTQTPPGWPPPTARRCGWPLRLHGNRAAALLPLRLRRRLPLLRRSSTPEPHRMCPRRHIAPLLWRRCGRRGCLCTGMPRRLPHRFGRPPRHRAALKQRRQPRGRAASWRPLRLRTRLAQAARALCRWRHARGVRAPRALHRGRTRMTL